MRILYTSDIHAGPHLLSQLMDAVLTNKVEAMIIGGDLIPHQLPLQPGRDIIHAQEAYLDTIFIPAFQTLQLKARIPVYLDMGNDDFIANRAILKTYTDSLFKLIHMDRCELTSAVDLIGYMVVPPTPFYRKDWEKPDMRDCPARPGNRVISHGQVTHRGVIEDVVMDFGSANTIEADLAGLAAKINKPFIFVSHSPPSDTPLDITSLGVHVGSLAIRNFIAHWADQGMLLATLHGHIHESFKMSGTIETRINGVLCINPGQNYGPNALLRYALLDLDEHDGKPVIRLVDSCQ